MKKLIIGILVCLFLLTAANVYAADSKSVVITIKNPLPVPVTKTLTFSAYVKDLSAETQFALFSNKYRLPLQVVRREGNTVRIKTVISLLPNESKLAVLKYGNSIKGSYNDLILKPNFSGTYFVGIGSGQLYITSLNDNNNIVVKFVGTDSSVSFKLDKNKYKIIPLEGRDVVFSITASYPVFAEVSSLKDDCLQKSSDDMSSVYGTYFVLYIPKEIIVSAYDAYPSTSTKLKISALSGKSIFNGFLPERGQYKNLNLISGFYVISASNPVTIQFGCEDDNVYDINYGALNVFKGVAYGNIICSALFPDTTVTLKTPSKQYPEIKLEKSGDYFYQDLITKFKDNESEMVPVYLQYSKPVLIYSDSNHGNIGGEQIPSIDGNNRNFAFLTGKIFNFSGLKHRRKIAIIPAESNTHILMNGKPLLLANAFSPRYILFDKSYSLVKVSSDKPISVFDVGMDTNYEYLSILIPMKDKSVTCSIGAAPVIPDGQNNNGKPSVTDGLSKFIIPVSTFFVNLGNNIQNLGWFKTVQTEINEFINDITPSLKNLSKQIITLFLPAANIVYPYVHKYLPNLSQGELAAIIFYMLLAFIVILLWPRRKKSRSVTIVKLKEEDLKKKKSVAFNVKTIEEKDVTGVKSGMQGKPKTLKISKEAIKGKSSGKLSSQQSFTSEGKTNALPYAKKSIEESISQKSKPVLRKTISGPTKEVTGSAVKNRGLLISKSKVLKTSKQELEKKRVDHIEPEEKRSVNFVPIEQRISPEEALKKILQKTKTEEEAISIKAEKAAKLEAEKAAKLEAEKAAIQNAIKDSDRKNTKSEKLPHTKEMPKKINRLAALFRPRNYISSGEITSSGKIADKNAGLPGKEQKKLVSREVQLTQKKAKIEAKKPEETKEVISKTSLDELLARVKREAKTGEYSATENAKTSNEFEEIAPGKNEEPVPKISVHLESSVVVDKNAANKCIQIGLIKRFGRVFISAKEQTDIVSEAKIKYRIGVIALTPIEIRIAEDLARRIAAKKSTGETLLIAKKVGVKQILVDDSPQITSYQGIKITNINEIIKK